MLTHDATPTKAAGVMLVTPEGSTLFICRSRSGDHSGEWSFPGGGVEDGEKPEDTIVRETREETGWIAPEDLDFDPKEKTNHDGYKTFEQKVGNQFIPTLNKEHTAYAWAPLDNPPEPLHPGVRKTIKSLAAGDQAALATTPNAGIPYAARHHFAEDQGVPFNTLATGAGYPAFDDELGFLDDDMPVEEPDVSGIKIDWKHQVLWMSVLSADGKTMYVHKDMPEEIVIAGKPLKTWEPLLRHEKAEWDAMVAMTEKYKKEHGGKEPSDEERAEIYSHAHVHYGTVAEKQWMLDNGYDWDKWESWTKGKLAHYENEPEDNPPDDSDVADFPHGAVKGKKGGGGGNIEFEGDQQFSGMSDYHQLNKDDEDYPGMSDYTGFVGDCPICQDRRLSFDCDPFSKKPIRQGIRFHCEVAPFGFVDDLAV